MVEILVILHSSSSSLAIFSKLGAPSITRGRNIGFYFCFLPDPLHSCLILNCAVRPDVNGPGHAWSSVILSAPTSSVTSGAFLPKYQTGRNHGPHL